MASWILSALTMMAVGGDADCTIVHFTASWCEPCRQLQPTLDRLQQEGWNVQPVDIDRQPQLPQQFRIQNLPTLVILSGGREVDRMVGAASYSQISRRLARVAARNQNGPSSRTSEPAQPTSTPQPIVRGQSPGLSAFPMLASAAAGALSTPASSLSHRPEPAPPEPPSGSPALGAARSGQLSIQEAIARAAAATVRIRVDEANTTAYGTGTLVDVHGDEALVLTCGHLFRNMKPGSQLSVDLLPGTAQEANLPAQLIDFKADKEDIGLISFRLPIRIEPVEILPRGEALQIGQRAFSFGCDHGDNPTRRDTQIKNINRYLGAANVEIAGAPAVGRSGGGLFDEQGRLIGVCNAADATDDEGIYAAAEVVYAQIERLGMEHLFEPGEVGSPANRLAGSTDSAMQLASSTVPARPGSTHSPGAPEAPGGLLRLPGQSSAAHDQTSSAVDVPTAASAQRQLICIVRDGTGPDRVVTIDAPPAELVERIEQHANR